MGKKSGGDFQFYTWQDMEPPGRSYMAEQLATTKQVWYGTNRRPNDSWSPDKGYGWENDSQLHTGMCEVRVPVKKQLARLDPGIIQRLIHKILKLPPEVRLVRIRPLDWPCLTDLSDEASSKEMLVFIHGYNVPFEDAVRWAAQISFDLKFPGTTALFSWPSRGDVRFYQHDEEIIRLSHQFLPQYLDGLATYGQASRIHLLAHSMGNRTLCEALKTLADSAPNRLKLGQVIMAAPDELTDIVQQAMDRCPLLQEKTGIERVTLYTSNRGRAVKLSYIIHGRLPRAGYWPPITILPNLDTIDATTEEGILALGRSYISEKAPLLYDLKSVLSGANDFNARIGLYQRRCEDKVYWKFK